MMRDVGFKERWLDLDLARLACTWLHPSPLAQPPSREFLPVSIAICCTRNSFH